MQSHSLRQKSSIFATSLKEGGKGFIQFTQQLCKLHISFLFYIVSVKKTLFFLQKCAKIYGEKLYVFLGFCARYF